jgi:hypothetical protein
MCAVLRMLVSTTSLTQSLLLELQCTSGTVLCVSQQQLQLQLVVGAHCEEHRGSCSQELVADTSSTAAPRISAVAAVQVVVNV